MWGDKRANNSIKPSLFFYFALKSRDGKLISTILKNLRDETSSIIENAIAIVYYMRGAIRYFDYYEMTYLERQKVTDFLEKRFREESQKPPHINRVY